MALGHQAEIFKDASKRERERVEVTRSAEITAVHKNVCFTFVPSFRSLAVGWIKVGNSVTCCWKAEITNL